MRKKTRRAIFGEPIIVVAYCETSGKPEFASRRVAKQAARDGRHRTDGRILREYRCPSCGGWHLTGQGSA